MYDYKHLKFCPRCSEKLLKKIVFGRKRLVCGNCGYIIYRNAYPATSGILENDGKILCLKRARDPKKGLWAIPGGFIEYEETAKQALKREFFEETGLKVNIKKLIGVYLFRSNPESNVLGPCYEVETIGGKLNIDKKESTNAKFFDINKLPKLAFKEHLKVISDWRKIYGR